MTTAKAKCKTCKTYRPQDELRKIGLSRVCRDNEECKVGVLRQVATLRRHDTSSPKPKSKRRSIPQAVRRKVVARDKSCRFCLEHTGRMEVHHIFYKSSGGPDRPVNLLLLCQEHHELVHSNKRYWQPILLAYIWLYYVESMRDLTIGKVERVLKKEGLLPAAHR